MGEGEKNTSHTAQQHRWYLAADLARCSWRRGGGGGWKVWHSEDWRSQTEAGEAVAEWKRTGCQLSAQNIGLSVLRCLLTVPYPHPSRSFAASLRSLTLTHLGRSLPPYGPLPSPTHLPPTTSLHACYNAMFFQKIHFFDINIPRS